MTIKYFDGMNLDELKDELIVFQNQFKLLEMEIENYKLGISAVELKLKSKLIDIKRTEFAIQFFDLEEYKLGQKVKEMFKDV